VETRQILFDQEHATRQLQKHFQVIIHRVFNEEICTHITYDMHVTRSLLYLRRKQLHVNWQTAGAQRPSCLSKQVQ
jgi:hypothetical protein